jgi:hypothetical protein
MFTQIPRSKKLIYPYREVKITGNIYPLSIGGVKYGLIIVTAIQGNQGIELLCPACQNRFQITAKQLGSELTCPTQDCRLKMKISPFLIHMA